MTGRRMPQFVITDTFREKVQKKNTSAKEKKTKKVLAATAELNEGANTQQYWTADTVHVFDTVGKILSDGWPLAEPTEPGVKGS